MIQSEPKSGGPNGLFQCGRAFLLLTAIGSIPFLLLILYFYKDEPYSRPPIPLLFLTPIPSCLFSIWYIRNLRNRERWLLTETELIGGQGKKLFLLNSIIKIIVGLPSATFIPAVGTTLDDDSNADDSMSASSAVEPQTGTITQNFQLRKFQRERTLLLVFNDGSLLPLYLLSASNGETLMTELKNRLKDCLVFNYNYSHNEAHKLSMLEANVVIPANKSPLGIGSTN